MGWACGSGYNKAHPSAPRLMGLSEDGEGSDNGGTGEQAVHTCLSIYFFGEIYTVSVYIFLVKSIPVSPENEK
jgi:hypothetical protein